MKRFLLSAVILAVCLVGFGSCTSFGTMMVGADNMYIADPAINATVDTGLVMTVYGGTLGSNPSYTNNYGKLVVCDNFLPPKGYAFCAVTVKVVNGGKDTQVDLNRTSMKTSSGATCLPFYAHTLVQFKMMSEKDIHENPMFVGKGETFKEDIPGTKKQIMMTIWYAIPIGDKPASIEFFGANAALKPYKK